MEEIGKAIHNVLRNGSENEVKMRLGENSTMLKF
jgi:hypothetical protein